MDLRPGRLHAFTDLAPVITANDVWRCLGPAGGARAKLADAVDWAVREACSLAIPQGLAVGATVARAGRARIEFQGGAQVDGRLIPHLLEGAEGAVFTLATAGPEIERRVAGLFGQGATVEAFVLDAAGSAVAMSVFGQVAAKIGIALEGRGLRVGPCVKPGTDAWQIEGQRTIFDIVPAISIGVRLLDSLLMSPQKTQSGLIPYGTDLRIVNDPEASPCRTCSALRCPMRTEPFEGGPTRVDAGLT